MLTCHRAQALDFSFLSTFTPWVVLGDFTTLCATFMLRTPRLMSPSQTTLLNPDHISNCLFEYLITSQTQPCEIELLILIPSSKQSRLMAATFFQWLSSKSWSHSWFFSHSHTSHLVCQHILSHLTVSIYPSIHLSSIYLLLICLYYVYHLFFHL